MCPPTLSNLIQHLVDEHAGAVSGSFCIQVMPLQCVLSDVKKLDPTIVQIGEQPPTCGLQRYLYSKEERTLVHLNTFALRSHATREEPK